MEETTNTTTQEASTPAPSTTPKQKRSSGAVPKGILAAAKVSDAELARAIGKSVGVKVDEKAFRRHIRSVHGKQRDRKATDAAVAKTGIEYVKGVKARRNSK